MYINYIYSGTSIMQARFMRHLAFIMNLPGLNDLPIEIPTVMYLKFGLHDT